MIIRKATQNDIDQIVDIGEIFQKEAFNSKFLTYDRETLSQNIKLIVENYIMIVAEEENIVGYLAARIEPSFFNKNETIARCMFVNLLPECRGKKVGKGLIETFEKIAGNVTAISYSSPHDSFIDMMGKHGYEVIEKQIMRGV